MSLSYNFDPTAIYLAPDLHETQDALLAYLEMDYNVKDKLIADPNECNEYVDIAQLQLGMKVRIGPNEEGPYYFVHAKVRYDLKMVKQDTKVWDMNQ